jgi:hypothetical protein
VSRRFRPARPTIAVLLGLLGALTVSVVPAAAAPVTRMPGKTIEVMSPYQAQSTCNPTPKPGTVALSKLVMAAYPGSGTSGIARDCSIGGRSEHKEGRAWDWHVVYANAKQRAQAADFAHWLFATDAYGNTFAQARRLGVMYVIWNHRIWGSYSQRWEPYTNCSGPTACHVDHMHISLDWSGAMKKTSFWTGKVEAPMPPPLQTLKVGQTATTTVSPRYAPTPAYRLVKGGRYVFTVTGTYNYDGQRHHRADAECSTTDGKHWYQRAAAEDTGKTGLLDLWVNNMHAWKAPTKSGCAVANHSYTKQMTVHRKTALAYAIHDTDQWGADGQLKVTVRRVA